MHGIKLTNGFGVASVPQFRRLRDRLGTIRTPPLVPGASTDTAPLATSKPPTGQVSRGRPLPSRRATAAPTVDITTRRLLLS
jgi:hypothetical protein